MCQINIGGRVTSVKLSSVALRVLALFLAAPDEACYGLEIAKAAGLRSSSLYPLLARLEDVGWLVSEWESQDPRIAGRPARRLYRMTELGADEARRELKPLYRSLERLGPALGAT